MFEFGLPDSAWDQNSDFFKNAIGPQVQKGFDLWGQTAEAQKFFSDMLGPTPTAVSQTTADAQVVSAAARVARGALQNPGGKKKKASSTLLTSGLGDTSPLTNLGKKTLLGQ